ncbi:MAG: right-handed parallel beta-helix repeat-containing protein, partial [Bacteroidia bacterium]
MKNSTKKILTTVTLLATLFFSVKGQTSVSGGIYSNTTWTLSGSPYTITADVVVFPGVTLTIQPGVTVKFDNAVELEIRQAALIAIGTSVDPITFTSSSASPTPGIWNSIYLNGGPMASKFTYCTFKYADKGINALSSTTVSDSLIIKNSDFSFNNNGVYYIGFDGTGGLPVRGMSSVDSCSFKYNTTYGLLLGYLAYGTVSNSDFSLNGTGLNTGGYTCPVNNCTFKSNQTGMASSYATANNCSFKHNQTGIASNSGNTIENCAIDSNSVTGISANGDMVTNCEIKYNDVGVQSAVSHIVGNDIEYNRVDINDNSGWNASVITGNIIKYSTVGIDNISEAFHITENTIENDSIGMRLNTSNSVIHCNKICNNYNYDIKYSASANIDISNNFWCASDSSSISTSIYDGYDNISYGLVNFMPLDTTSCYLATGIHEAESSFSFGLFPNPATDHLTLELPA